MEAAPVNFGGDGFILEPGSEAGRTVCGGDDKSRLHLAKVLQVFLLVIGRLYR